MSIFVFATVFPQPEKLAEVEAVLLEAVAASRREPGCLRYDLFRTQQGEAAFQFFEQYSDGAALAAHAASPHFLALKEKLASLLARPLVVSITGAVDVAD